MWCSFPLHGTRTTTRNLELISMADVSTQTSSGGASTASLVVGVAGIVAVFSGKRIR